MEVEIEPVPGFYNLRLVDPVKARMIMSAENKELDDIVRVSCFSNFQNFFQFYFF